MIIWLRTAANLSVNWKGYCFESNTMYYTSIYQPSHLILNLKTCCLPTGYYKYLYMCLWGKCLQKITTYLYARQPEPNKTIVESQTGHKYFSGKAQVLQWTRKPTQCGVRNHTGINFLKGKAAHLRLFRSGLVRWLISCFQFIIHQYFSK